MSKYMFRYYIKVLAHLSQGLIRRAYVYPSNRRPSISLSVLVFVTTLAPSFLIGSSSLLQVTRTPIRSRMSSKFDKILPGTAELAALDHLENPQRLIMR